MKSAEQIASDLKHLTAPWDLSYQQLSLGMDLSISPLSLEMQHEERSGEDDGDLPLEAA